MSPKHEKPKKPHPKAGAIILIIVAVLLVAAVVAALLFWHSLSRSADQLFTRQAAAVPTIPPAPEATPIRYDDIEADWIDINGNAYNYRDDVINILFIGVDYMYKKSPTFRSPLII